ncbi:MAG TPA: DNA-binding protein [Firmicutes bacterium]|nr:DNA-binding protein [Bacillota bacterium]
MDEILTMEEAAEFIGVDRTTLYRWAKAGKITIYKKGRNSVIKKADAEKVKAENEELKPLFPQKPE